MEFSSPLFLLHKDLWRTVLSYLSPIDLVHFHQTSSRCRALARPLFSNARNVVLRDIHWQGEKKSKLVRRLRKQDAREVCLKYARAQKMVSWLSKAEVSIFEDAYSLMHKTSKCESGNIEGSILVSEQYTDPFWGRKRTTTSRISVSYAIEQRKAFVTHSLKTDTSTLSPDLLKHDIVLVCSCGTPLRAQGYPSMLAKYIYHRLTLFDAKRRFCWWKVD